LCGKHTLCFAIAAALGGEAFAEKILLGNCSDVRVFGLPKDKKTISVDVVRQIKESVYLKPVELHCKIYLLEQTELMTTQAQNALLKLLEEPPQSVSFLLLSGAGDQLLPTVLSRVGRRSLDESEQTTEIDSAVLYETLDALFSLDLMDTVSCVETLLKADSPRAEIGILLSWFGQVLTAQQGRITPTDERMKKAVLKLSKKATLGVLEHLGALEREMRYNIKKETALTATLLRCWEEIHDRDCGN
jgi:DNA polymerase III gamma/tau subunit